MSYRVVHELSDAQVEDLLQLYRGEWWCRSRTLDDVRTMLSQCSVIIGLIDNETDRLVGFTRVLSDGVYKAMVFDVIVHPDLRGQGLGDALMDAVVNHPRLRNVESFELYCLPEMAGFYERWGFSDDVAGCVFMRRNRSANESG